MIGPQITTASGLNFSGLKYATPSENAQKEQGETFRKLSISIPKKNEKRAKLLKN